MKLLFTPRDLAVEFKRLTHAYENFDWAVAWASTGFDAFSMLKKHRSKIRHIVVGTEFHQTHPDFIAEFQHHKNVRFRLDQSGLDGVFHPKVYLFSNDRVSWEAIIGSANFTNAAFTRNIECAVLLTSSDDASASTYDEIFAQIQMLWNAATSVTDQQLEAYRIRWRYNKKRLADAEGHSGSGSRVASVYECPLLTLDWPTFYQNIQAERNNWFQDRLALLRETGTVFRQKQSLSAMTKAERKQICGTAVEGAIKWRLFGSMAGAVPLKKRIADNDSVLSAALDQIPLNGPVTKHDYDSYVSKLRSTFVYKNGFNGLAVATRLLCIKRPDYFVCIDGKNKDGVARALGVKKSSLTIDSYWDIVVTPVLESAWYNSKRPNSPTEALAWDARVALMDSLFYRP